MSVGDAITGRQFIERLQTLYAGAQPWDVEATRLAIGTIDAGGYSATECDEAMRRLIAHGSQFMPTPATVSSTLSATRRDLMRYQEPALALPVVTTMAREWLIGLYGDEGREITWDEHIRRWHATKNPNGCGGRFCDVCNSHTETTIEEMAV